MRKLLLFFIIPAILIGGFLFNDFALSHKNLYLKNNACQIKFCLNTCKGCEEILSFDKILTLTEFNSELPENVKIISNSIKIYQTADVNSEVLGTAYYGEIFEVVSVQNDFYEIIVSEDVFGYILMAYALDSSIKSPLIHLDTNATLTETSSVFRLVGGEYLEVDDISLEKNTRIKVLDGYDINKEYCKVSFTFQDEIFTYYLLTENIDPDGIGSRFIVAISLIVVCVSIFLILYSFFKGRVRK